ncbi:GNAT family N-acetyltransferase [bacterium]|nr:GNAT family N-acetyltransferase [bacterium]
MEPADTTRVLEIIHSHEPYDADCAKRYYSEYFERYGGGMPGHLNYVAVDTSGLVQGVCGYSPDKYETEGVLWLTWFYVSKEAQGSLVGFRLYERVLADVKTLNCRKLCLDTCNTEQYHRALKFYTKCGFSISGIIENYYGHGEHMMLMDIDYSA